MQEYKSDDSSFDNTSPLAQAIATSRDVQNHHSKHLSSSSLEAVAKNLQRVFDDEPVASEPRVSCVDSRSPPPARQVSVPTTETSRAESAVESTCDTCCGKHEQKNAVRPVDPQRYEIYSSVSMVDIRSDGIVVRPFLDVLAKLQRSVEASSTGDSGAPVQVALCRKCERQLNSLISMRNNKRRDHQMESIYASFFRRRDKATGTATHDHTVQTLRCFLQGKGSMDCTEGSHYRPLRLKTRSHAILKAWKDLFASKAGVGSYLVSQLLQNCGTEVLCPSHTALMTNSLLTVELAATKCSVCQRQEKKRGRSEVTVVDHTAIEKNEENMCLIEDALAVYTENTIQISQVKQLCAPCRLVLFRHISLRENRPRDDCAVKMRFDYGPTPSAIRKSIQRIRKMLLQEGKLVVFLTDVWEFYQSVTSEVEKTLEIKDPRTLKKYLLPSLASTGIFLEIGSRKVGSYFCTTASFGMLAKDIKRKGDSPSFVHSVDNMSWERERELLLELADVFKRKRETIEQSGWNLREFILLVPADLWRRKVVVRGSNRLLRRCKAAANIRNVNFYEEWPCNPQECPTDLRLRPNHEQRFVSTIFCMLEQDSFEVSNRSSQGPLNYSLTLCGYMRADKEFMRLLNKVGIAGSYQCSQRIKNAAIYQHQSRGAFSHTVPDAFHTVAVDNVNVRAGHSVAVHGKTYDGFNGTAAQAVNSNVKFNVAGFLKSRTISELEVRRVEGMKREDFVEEMFPTHDDPDLKGYRWTVVGLVLQHREQLASKNAKEQRSFRGLLLDAFKGYSGGKSKVTYVDVNRSNAQDPLSIVRQLGLIEEALVTKQTQPTFVGVVGDQPVFKILFELWYDSYLKKSKLHRWMIPIPGGFHIDKQGLIPLTKTFLTGAGLEEEVVFSGLSTAHQEGFFGLAHFRKSRRVLHQICAAEIMRVADVVSENPSVEKDLRSMLHGDFSRTTLTDLRVGDAVGTLAAVTQNEGLAIDMDGQRDADLRGVLPDGCSLELTDLVSRKTVLIGKLICDEIEKLSEHSKNFRYLAKRRLLELLIPSTGYHIMCRRGQTEVMDKFWFFSVGLLHVTNKINYMENMIYYAFIKKAMPKAAYDIIYRFRHLVMSFSPDCLKANLNLDEAMEMGLVRHLKMLTTNDPEVLERSVAWLKLICRAFDILRRELNSSPSQAARTDDLPATKDEIVSETRNDKEKKTALNVLMIYEFLTRKNWLGEAHRASEYLSNVLVSPLFELKNKHHEKRLLDADEIGRVAAALHISRKFSEVFGGLSKEDLENHLKGKEPKGWTLAFRIPTMREANYVAYRTLGKRKSSKKKLPVDRRIMKRFKHLSNVKARLLQVTLKSDFSGESDLERGMRLRSAKVLLQQIEDNDHLMVPQAMAFRSDSSNSYSIHEDRREFYRSLQGLFDRLRASSLSKIPTAGNSSPPSAVEVEPKTFLHKSNLRYVADVAIIHVDLMPIVQQSASPTMENTTIGNTIYEKVSRYISVYVDTANFPKTREFHFHLDVAHFMPVQRARFKEKKSRSFTWLGGKQAELGQDDLDVDDCEDVDGTDLSHGEGNRRSVCLGYDSVYSGSWSSVLRDEGNKRFIEKLHAVLSAKAVIDLVREPVRQTNRTSGSSTLNQSGSGIGDIRQTGAGNNDNSISVYIHGVELLMASDVHDAMLEDILFSRTEDLLVLSRRDGLIVRKSGEIITNAVSYDASCCWQVSENGFERLVSGDSSHAEAGMRFVNSLVNISQPNFLDSSLESREWTALFISNDRSSPIISVLPELLGIFRVYIKLENDIVDVNVLRELLLSVKVIPEEMAVLFGLAGGDLCPATQHVRMMCFAEALIRYRHKLRPFTYPELSDDVSRFSAKHWLNMENVIAAAYVVSLQSSATVDDVHKSMFSKLNTDDEARDWAHEVRRWVAQLKRVDRATRFMPEKADLELQSRRAVWLLQYWRTATNFGYQQCDKPAATVVPDRQSGDEQMRKWGFTIDGEPMLERPEDVAAREKILRCDYQRCSCKGGCNTSRCSCRRHSPPIYCTLCDCSAENCENRGALDKTSLLSSDEVARIEDELGSGAEDSSSDDSENDSSSIESLIT